MALKPTYSIVIVTHNSERHIHKCIAAIEAQSLPPERIVISDSGSQDPSYLDRYRGHPGMVIITHPSDIGFCEGNNAAMPYVSPDSGYVLFLKPDAFLTPNFCSKAIAIMEQPANKQVGALSGILLGYDIDADAPTGRYDSTAIFNTWYGHWFDRDKGSVVMPNKYSTAEHVPALCGALMFCRHQALNDILLRGTEVWDSTLHMYKDDIDLSLRLRSKGWKLLFDPSLEAYHCRGWLVDRRRMPRKYRVMSALNEVRINAKHCRMGIPYSLSKYYAVKIFDL